MHATLFMGAAIDHLIHSEGDKARAQLLAAINEP